MPIILANWKRLIGWAVLIFVLFQTVALLVLATPGAFASTFLAQLSAFVLYFQFFRRTESHKVLLGVALFLLIQLVDIAALFALSGSLAGWLDPLGTAISFAVCALAYLASQLSSNNSSKPTPLRGAA